MGTTGIGAGAARAHLRRREARPRLEQPSESAAGQLDLLDRPTCCNASWRFSIVSEARAAYEEHVATHSSASSCSQGRHFAVGSRSFVRSPFTLGTQHVPCAHARPAQQHSTSSHTRARDARTVRPRKNRTAGGPSLERNQTHSRSCTPPPFAGPLSPSRTNLPCVLAFSAVIMAAPLLALGLHGMPDRMTITSASSARSSPAPSPSPAAAAAAEAAPISHLTRLIR